MVNVEVSGREADGSSSRMAGTQKCARVGKPDRKVQRSDSMRRYRLMLMVRAMIRKRIDGLMGKITDRDSSGKSGYKNRYKIRVSR